MHGRDCFASRRLPVCALLACSAIGAMSLAPRPANAAIIPLSESHLLNARASLGTTVDEHSTPGSSNSPTSPVDATATALAAPGTAATSLHLGFDALTITGRVTADTGASPSDFPVSAQADGTFTLNFEVTEPMNFTLTGVVSVHTLFPDDAGRSQLLLREDGTYIGGGLIGQGTGVPEGETSVNGQGVLRPGRAYELTGGITGVQRCEPRGRR